MKQKRIGIFIALLFLGVLFYPKEVTLTPEVDLYVRYEDGKEASKIEVRRDWITYVTGDGWNRDFQFTDEQGRVKFNAVKKRVPIILERLNYYLPYLSMHENNLNVGDIQSRNPKDHFTWGRVDYTDKNCCPKVLILKKENSDLPDWYFYMD
jgi:hypothetical protein